MQRHRRGECVQVIPTLQDRDQPPLAHPSSQFAQSCGEPAIIGGVELQLRERIRPVRIEPGRDDQELRVERRDRRQDVVGPRGAERGAAGARRERHVQHVARCAALGGQAGAGKAGMLVRRGVEEPGDGPRRVLGAVAVMHVEIHHGNPFQPPSRHGVPGGDCGRGEQAESHRVGAPRMVAGWAGGDEGGPCPTLHHAIDRGHRAAGGSQGRLDRTGADQRVAAVERHPRAGRRGEPQDRRHVVRVVDETELFRRGARGLLARQGSEGRIVEGGENPPQPLGRFRVPGAGVVPNPNPLGLGHVVT